MSTLFSALVKIYGRKAALVLFALMALIGVTSSVSMAASEGALTGPVAGPAIVQWWDGGSQCGVAKVNVGQTFPGGYKGYYWAAFNSQAALNQRYDNHAKAFLANSEGCVNGWPNGEAAAPAQESAPAEKVETTKSEQPAKSGAIEVRRSGALRNAKVRGLAIIEWYGRGRCGVTYQNAEDVSATGHFNGTFWELKGDEEAFWANYLKHRGNFLANNPDCREGWYPAPDALND